MKIYTIGFTKKSAEQFFGLLRAAQIKLLVDVRLNNVNQLAGFTKKDDLKFFLEEICGAEYIHEPQLAPTTGIFELRSSNGGDLVTFEREFLHLLAQRRIEDTIPKSWFDVPAVLLCSEATPEECHRRLVVEYLSRKWGDVEAVHL